MKWAVTEPVFAPGGYLVHDLSEAVRITLSVSVAPGNADRMAALIEYFAADASSLVVALSPLDVTALDDDPSVVRNDSRPAIPRDETNRQK